MEAFISIQTLLIGKNRELLSSYSSFNFRSKKPQKKITMTLIILLLKWTETSKQTKEEWKSYNFIVFATKNKHAISSKFGISGITDIR